MNPADIILGIANCGLAIVFYPMVVRNWRRGYCHIPIMTSAPKTVLLGLALVGFLVADLPIAAAMCAIDFACWIILVGQRLTLDH